MLVEFLSRDYSQPFGLPRYNDSLRACLQGSDVEFRTVPLYAPLIAKKAGPILSRFDLDIETFLQTYPVTTRLSPNSVKHFPDYTMATALVFNKLRHTVVTVHDFTPDWNSAEKSPRISRYTIYQAFNRMALAGLKKADAIITDTYHIADSIIESTGCSMDRIFVIPLGVAHDIFRPIEVQQDFLDRYSLSKDYLYILNVGTDAPRKNLPNLIKAFAQVKKDVPNAKLLKVGSSGWTDNFVGVRELIHRLDIEEDIRFLGTVSDDDLARLYDVATISVYPSLYEGFGLPVLEAMACGTPVITSNISTLPEVAGDAAILVDPRDENGIAAAMINVLTDTGLQKALRLKGLSRAGEFTWEQTAEKTLAIYKYVFRN